MRIELCEERQGVAEHGARADAVLVFPPGWTPFSPYLALPCLKAYLSKRGLSSLTLDWNLSYFDKVLSPSWLRRAVNKCEMCLRQYNDLSQLDDNQDRHFRLVVRALLLAGSVNSVDDAKRVFRSRSFYEKDKYEWAKRTLVECLEIASASFPGLHLQFNEITVPSAVGAHLPSWINDPCKNPFIDDVDSLIDLDLPSGPIGVLGISVTSESQLLTALTVAARARRARPEVQHIVLGGNYITRLASDWTHSNEIAEFADSIILFEGEDGLATLVQRVKSGDDFRDIPSLGYSQGRSFVRNATSTVPPSELPTPDFSDFELERYLMPEVILPIYSSRSCFATCSFCTIPFSAGGSYRTIRPAEVFETMETLHERHGVTLFDIVDETIAPPNMRKLAHLIAASGKPFRWYGETRFSRHYDDELCQKLYAGGCRKLQFGLESYNQGVLDLMQKQVRLEHIEPTLDACRYAGISVHLFFMIGFPGETEDEALRSLAFTSKMLEKASECGNPHWTRGWGLFSLEKHSDVYARPEHYGVTITGEVGHLGHITRVEHETSMGMSRERASELVDSSRQRIEVLLRKQGFFPFHTHNLNLNSEEESFLRICHSDRHELATEGEPFDPRVMPMTRVTATHAFLTSRTKTPRDVVYDPQTRHVCEVPPRLDPGHAKAAAWVFLANDWGRFAYDINSGRRLKIDPASFQFLSAVRKHGSVSKARLVLLAKLELSSCIIDSIIDRAVAAGVIVPN